METLFACVGGRERCGAGMFLHASPADDDNVGLSHAASFHSSRR